MLRPGAAEGNADPAAWEAIEVKRKAMNAEARKVLQTAVKTWRKRASRYTYFLQVRELLDNLNTVYMAG